MGNVIGRNPNQIPVNQYLGKLAYKDNNVPLIKTISTDYSLSKSDDNVIFIVSGTTNINLPDVSTVSNSFRVIIKAITGSTVTVVRSGTDTIETVAGDKSMIANTGLMFFPVSGGWETI